MHLHLLVGDGAWRQTPDGRVQFLPLSEPTHADLHAVLAAVHDDLAAAGLDDAPDVDPSLLACAQLSLSTTAATQTRDLAVRWLAVPTLSDLDALHRDTGGRVVPDDVEGPEVVAHLPVEGIQGYDATAVAIVSGKSRRLDHELAGLAV